MIRGSTGRATARLLLMAVSAGSVLAEAAGAAPARQPRRDPIAFSLVQAAAVRSLVAGMADPGRARPQPLEFSDLMLEVSSPDGDAAAALAAADGARRAGSRGLFRFRLLAVVAGRLRTGAGGWCSPWRRDESWCELDCEGGGFMLRRSAPGAGGGLEMTVHGAEREPGVRAPAGGIDEDDPRVSGSGSGISLSACRVEGDGDLRLAPADGRPSARLAFVEH
jgi:hypothetical protein